MRATIIWAAIIISTPFYEKYVNVNKENTEKLVAIFGASILIVSIFDILEFLKIMGVL